MHGPIVPHNTETCRGLEQLAANTNPNYLSNCARDRDCTQVMCSGSGLLSGQVDSAIITLSPCLTMPGIIVKLLKDGTAVINEQVTGPFRISHNVDFATVGVNLFVNSSSSTIGILVRVLYLLVCFQRISSFMYSWGYGIITTN